MDDGEQVITGRARRRVIHTRSEVATIGFTIAGLEVDAGVYVGTEVTEDPQHAPSVTTAHEVDTVTDTVHDAQMRQVPLVTTKVQRGLRICLSQSQLGALPRGTWITDTAPGGLRLTLTAGDPGGDGTGIGISTSDERGRVTLATGAARLVGICPSDHLIVIRPQPDHLIVINAVSLATDWINNSNGQERR